VPCAHLVRARVRPDLIFCLRGGAVWCCAVQVRICAFPASSLGLSNVAISPDARPQEGWSMRQVWEEGWTEPRPATNKAAPAVLWVPMVYHLDGSPLRLEGHH